MSHRKSDVSTRLEEEDKNSLLNPASDLSPNENENEYLESEEHDSDEDIELLKSFNVDEAWENLINAEDCSKVVLNQQQQQDMELEIGVNISAQFPWKQVKLKCLADYFFDEVPNTESIKEKFQYMKPDDLILMGYVPKLSKKQDTFLIFETPEASKNASEIIKNIETFERWKLNQTLVKQGRKWKSKGSEKEVDLGIAIRQLNMVDVEVQSVYTIKHSAAKFSQRLAGDVRDAYVELVPGSRKFDNIFRKRIDVCIQSAPARVHLEQQTNPTFPTNAWSQYLYEINAEDDGLDPSEDDQKTEKEEKQKISSKTTSPAPIDTPIPPTPPPPPDMSGQICNLLSTLEFNQVDMYRNDYPQIAMLKVPKYTTPYLEEVLCFANISKSIKRVVCSVDWYPTVSGLVVTTYTFSTRSTYVKADDQTDVIKRAAVEPNPILMWSFDDTLNYKLEFESPREVTCISFCPYDENLLVGGTINGQVIIWDLQDRIKKIGVEDILSTAKMRCKNIIKSCLKGTKPISQLPVVRPAAISALDTSQTGAITNIKWLHRNQYISMTGQARENEKEKYRYFLTNSLDGTVSFWNLDEPIEVQVSKSNLQEDLPPELIQNISAYKKLDRVFKPQYIIQHQHPLNSIIFDKAVFEYNPYNLSKQIRKISIKLPIMVHPVEQELFRQKVICGSMAGGLHSITWAGDETLHAKEITKENVETAEEFARIHDGPVLGLEKNPFIPELIASISRNKMAIWKESLPSKPILWRRRPSALTNLQWSLDRPPILYLTTADGSFEAWNILSRTDEPCLVDILGGSVITALAEHRPAMPNKLMGIGDYDSSFKMLIIPELLQKAAPNELERLKEFINKEELRKTQLDIWQKEWSEKNSDIREAQQALAEESKMELEKLQKEIRLQDELRAKRDAEEAKKLANTEKRKMIYDLPERLEKKWDEKNLRHLMNVVMSQKFVDPAKLEKQAALEKKRLFYIKSKKVALNNRLKKIDEDIATIRARLLPFEKRTKSRKEIVEESSNNIVNESKSFSIVEEDSNKRKDISPIGADITHREFLLRGKMHREVINKSLGANTERRHLYKIMKQEGTLMNFDLGYENFYEPKKQSATTVQETNGEIKSDTFIEEATTE